jgi:hypothetical protein
MTIGQFMLGCQEREWNEWLPHWELLQQQQETVITQATKLMEGTSLSVLFKLLVSNPVVIGQGGPELVAMVIADTETRNDNSNVQSLLLDSMSTIHIVTSKKGMTDLQPCNKAVNAANKGRSYVKEVGIWKFRMAGKSRSLIVSMEDTHSILEGFMHYLISLPKLLKKNKITH